MSRDDAVRLDGLSSKPSEISPVLANDGGILNFGKLGTATADGINCEVEVTLASPSEEAAKITRIRETRIFIDSQSRQNTLNSITHSCMFRVPIKPTYVEICLMD